MSKHPTERMESEGANELLRKERREQKRQARAMRKYVWAHAELLRNITIPREWVEVQKYGRDKGWIPRDVLERMGVNCAPLDKQPQGTVWFNCEQSEAIRQHPEWHEGDLDVQSYRANGEWRERSV